MKFDGNAFANGILGFILIATVFAGVLGLCKLAYDDGYHAGWKCGSNKEFCP